MDWELILSIVAAVVLILALVIVARRNMNHNYTIGSGMYKMSDNNLEKDKHVDPADFDYYNSKGNTR